LKDLNKVIYEELRNPERLKKERAQIAIDDGGFDILDPLENLIKIITT
jgi:hypothetical protein